MKVFVTGGTGFVGRQLVAVLLDSGHEVTCLGRSDYSHMALDNFTYITGSTTEPGDWQDFLKDADVVINLAGAPISKHWNEQYKKEIYDSRILTTKNIVNGLPENTKATLISASATGFYGDRKEEILTETAAPGHGFLAKVANDWEEEAKLAEKKGARVVLTRFGVVMGRNGGALDKLISVTKGYVGGPLGNGKQWFPWIHMADLISAILFVMDNEKISGPVNVSTPIPTRQKDIAKALGKKLKRPAFMPAPAFMMRLVLGEFADTLLQSQKVIPDKLIKHGFKFKFLEISTALEDILK